MERIASTLMPRSGAGTITAAAGDAARTDHNGSRRRGPAAMPHEDEDARSVSSGRVLTMPLPPSVGHVPRDWPRHLHSIGLAHDPVKARKYPSLAIDGWQAIGVCQFEAREGLEPLATGLSSPECLAPSRRRQMRPRFPQDSSASQTRLLYPLAARDGPPRNEGGGRRDSLR